LMAARAAGQMGVAARQAVPSLVQLLSDPDCRSAASDALGEIGPHAKGAIPELMRLGNGKDGSGRGDAAFTLWQIDRQTPATVARLLSGVKDPNPVTRYQAICYLGEMGPEARPAIPVLRELLKAKDRDCRRLAGEVLKKVDREAARQD